MSLKNALQHIYGVRSIYNIVNVCITYPDAAYKFIKCIYIFIPCNRFKFNEKINKSDPDMCVQRVFSLKKLSVGSSACHIAHYKNPMQGTKCSSQRALYKGASRHQFCTMQWRSASEPCTINGS